jgi:DNA-binding CsgD family transcriptional regulator
VNRPEKSAIKLSGAGTSPATADLVPPVKKPHRSNFSSSISLNVALRDGKMSTSIETHDIASLLRLAGEVSELKPDVQSRREHILNRLLDLIGGRFAVCSEVRPSNGQLHCWAVPGSVTFGGDMPPQMREQVQQYVEGNLAALDPCVPALLRKGSTTATVRREDVIDRSWFRSEHFNTLRRPWGIGESLYGKLITPDDRRLKVTLHRELNDQPFTERDLRLMHLFNENLSGLYANPPARPEAAQDVVDPQIRSLPPRLQPVLQRLLAGDSEKQAAAQLGLSPHTIHAYAKLLYRTFAVNSKGELLARFVKQPIA